MTDGYVSKEDIEIMRQLRRNVEITALESKNSDLKLEKAHADKRAAEAEMRASEAEYQSATIKMYWKYKLNDEYHIRQSDGLIMKGDNNDQEEKPPSDVSPEGENDSGDG